MNRNCCLSVCGSFCLLFCLFSGLSVVIYILIFQVPQPTFSLLAKMPLKSPYLGCWVYDLNILKHQTEFVLLRFVSQYSTKRWWVFFYVYVYWDFDKPTHKRCSEGKYYVLIFFLYSLCSVHIGKCLVKKFVKWKMK